MSIHTDRQYEEELAELRRRILEMGGLVEKQIGDAVRALVTRDRALAEATVRRDHAVNRLDVAIDDLCIRLLALRQPAGRDLRFVTTALKITTDLERIGDQAASIAERALEIAGEPVLEPAVDLPRMADSAAGMVRQSLDAFLREDTELALDVCRRDDEVDEQNDRIFRQLLALMTEDPRSIGRAMRVLFASKCLERIGDHATNVAEMVVFMVKGKSIRHVDEIPPAL